MENKREEEQERETMSPARFEQSLRRGKGVLERSYITKKIRR